MTSISGFGALKLNYNVLLLRRLNVFSVQRSSVSFGLFSLSRDIAKNSLLQWPTFIYWTILGVYDAVVMFFGAYFLFDNTTFTSNGQVMSVILLLLVFASGKQTLHSNTQTQTLKQHRCQSVIAVA